MPIVNGINLDEYDFGDSPTSDSLSDSPKQTVNGIDLGKYSFGEENKAVPETASPPLTEEGSFLRRVPDLGVSLLKGAVGLPEAVVGLLDIPTMGYAGKGAEALGIRFKETQEILDSLYSPQQQEANRKVAEAKGFTSTIGTAFENPSTILQMVAESAPSMVGAGGIGRGLIKFFPKLSAVIAGSAGEAAISGGQAAEQIRQGEESGLLSAGQAGIAGLSGMLTGILGVVGGKLAKRLGIVDVDTLIAGGSVRAAVDDATAVAKKNVLRKMIESAISEGAFEELPQSLQEKMAQNIATGKPATEGVAEAGAMGMLAGGVMGAFGGAGGHVLSGMEILQKDKENQDRSQEIQTFVANKGYADLNNNDLLQAYAESDAVQKELPDDANLSASMATMKSELEKRGIWPEDKLSVDIESKLAELDTDGSIQDSTDAAIKNETEGQVTNPTIPQGEDIKTEPPMADTSEEIASSPSTIPTENILPDASEMEGMANPPSTPEKTSQEATQENTAKGWEPSKADKDEDYEPTLAQDLDELYRNTIKPLVASDPLLEKAETQQSLDSIRESAIEYLRRTYGLEKADESTGRSAGTGEAGVDESGGLDRQIRAEITTAKRAAVKTRILNAYREQFTGNSEVETNEIRNAAINELGLNPQRRKMFEQAVIAIANGELKNPAIQKTIDNGIPIPSELLKGKAQPKAVAKSKAVPKVEKPKKKKVEKKKPVQEVLKPEKAEPKTKKPSPKPPKEVTLESHVRKNKVNFNIPGHSNKEAISDGLLSFVKNDAVPADKAAEELQSMGLLGATPDGYATAGDYLYAELQRTVYNKKNKIIQSLTAEEEQAIKEFKEASLDEGYDESDIEAEVREDQRTGKKEAYSIKDSEAHGEAQSILEADEDFVAEEEAPTTELFDTSEMFTLSGNQPVEPKTMKVPEKKGDRLLDVKKQTTDELKDRLSGEKAKREFEEGKQKPQSFPDFKSFVESKGKVLASLSDKERAKLTKEYNATKVTDGEETKLKVSEDKNDSTRALRENRDVGLSDDSRSVQNPTLASSRRIQSGRGVDGRMQKERERNGSKGSNDSADTLNLKVGTTPKPNLLSSKDSQALVSDILQILADGSAITFTEKIDPNRPDIQNALAQWKQGNPDASFVIEGMHRKVIVDRNTMASLIEVSMGSSDIKATAWHEAWHSIDEIFLTANEKQVLAEKLTPDVERQADIFAKYAANQKHLIPKSAKPIFERVKAFFEKVGNYLRGKGFTNAEDVFDRALRGELKERAQRWTGEGQAAFKMGEGKFNAAFRKWFGDSKVVDENGEPLVVYHGTTKAIEAFTNKNGRNLIGWKDAEGFYFSVFPEESSDYALHPANQHTNEGANVVPVYLNLQNPKIVKTAQGTALIDTNQREELIKEGYDGVMTADKREIVAFFPSQIKSVYNQGTWDENDPRISFKIAPVIRNLIDRNAKKAGNPERFPLPADKEFQRLYTEAMGKDYSKIKAYVLTPAGKAYGPNARPEWTANYNNFKGAREERQTLNSEFIRSIDNFMNKPAEKIVNVEKVFFEGDATLGQKIRDLKHEAVQAKLGGNLELAGQLKERARVIKELNRYSDEELANGITIERTGEVVKLNPEEIATYKELRDGYDRLLRFLLENMANVAFDRYSDTPWFPSMIDLFSDVAIRQTDAQKKTLRALNKLALNKIRGKKAETIQKNRAALKDIVKEHISAISGVTNQIELSTMAKEMIEAYKKERVSINAIKKARNRIGQITAYAPRVREQANAYLNIYRTVKSMSKDGNEKITKELVANYTIEEKAIYKLKPELRGQEINRMWEDYKSRHKNEDLSYKVDKTSRESDTSYRGVNDMNLQRIIDNAIDSIRGTRTLTDGPVLNDLKGSLIQAVANEMKVRGFGRSLVSRKLQHIEGYKTTGLQKITLDYITGLTGMVTKQKAALRAYDILKTVPEDNTILYEDLAKFTQDMLRNQNSLDRASGKFKGLLFTWYLSGLLKMVPIQLTQNYATGMPMMAKKMREWGIKGISEPRYHKAMADATTIRVDDKTGEVKQNKRINKMEARLLTESLHNGNTADQYVRYITGLMDGQLGQKTTWILDKMAKPFSKMETFNRESASLAMFRMAWEHYTETVPDLEERYQLAKQEADRFVSRTHFDFGKENLPRIATGGDLMSITAKTLMTFRSFNHNYVQFILGSKDWKTIAHSLAYIALFGGMMGLPFIKDILDLLEKLTGKSYTKSAREVMRKYGGRTLETFGIQGLPALAGANISGSLAMGIPFADWMTGGSTSNTVYGVVGGMGEKIGKGVKYGMKGEFYRAAESLAPEVLASPMKAMRTSQIGKEYFGTPGFDTTASGKPKFDENGKPLSMDTGDVIAKMMGFNPSGYSMKNEAQRSASNIEEYFSDWKTSIYETYRAGRINHDSKTISKALRQIREYNQAIVDKEAMGLIPRIKMSNVVKASKMEMTKKQKREALYKRNYLAS